MQSVNNEFRNRRYETFILAISIISLVNIALLFIPMKEEMHNVVELYDIFLSFFLMGDFIYRLVKAPSTTGYLIKGFGWLDFLGSMPLLGMRLFRLFRVARVIQYLGRDGVKSLWQSFREHRANAALLSVFFLILFSLEFASLAILNVEPEVAGANILTATDALWWSYVSITTVGYGDLFPVTDAGRVIGVFLLAIGIGLFTILTGNLAKTFLAPRNEGNQSSGKEYISDPFQQLEEIKKLLAEQETANADMREKLKHLEELL